MRHRARTLVTGLGAIALLTVAAPASAQTSSQGYPAACAQDTVPKSEADKAHDLYKAGKVQYDERGWDAAISLFKEAYKKDCAKHELLIIISRAYEGKRDFPEAIRALELFLEREPKSPDVGTYKARIASLKDELAKQPPPATPAPAPATPSNNASKDPKPEAPVREHTVPPWIVVGLGGAAIVAGVVVLATSPSLPKACNPDTLTCPPGSSQSVKDEAAASQNQPKIGAVVIGGGAVLVGAGLLWHFLEPTGPETQASTKTKLTPSVAPGYAGLSFGGSF